MFLHWLWTSPVKSGKRHAVCLSLLKITPTKHLIASYCCFFARSWWYISQMPQRVTGIVNHEPLRQSKVLAIFVCITGQFCKRRWYLSFTEQIISSLTIEICQCDYMEALSWSKLIFTHANGRRGGSVFYLRLSVCLSVSPYNISQIHAARSTKRDRNVPDKSRKPNYFGVKWS